MLTDKDKQEIVATLNLFMNSIREWEEYCNELDKKNTLPNDKKVEIQKEKLINIFDSCATPRERKEGRPGTISYSLDNDYPEEKIISIEEYKKNKAIVYTKQNDSLESKYQYIFINNIGKWLIDSKKRFSDWKKKWVNESL